MRCPWLGLCDDAEEIVGRKDEHCNCGFYHSCPTWKEDPYMNYGSPKQTVIKDE